MRVVEINDVDFNLPTGWEDISVRKLEEIVKHSSLLSQYKSKTLFSIELFAILLEAPVSLIKKLDRDAFEKLSEECNWVNTKIVGSDKKQFEIDGEIYVPLIEFNKMNMADAVNFELIINDANDETILGDILPLLLRKAKPIINSKGETKLVPDEFDEDRYDELKELFKNNMMVTDVINFKDFFLNGEK